MPLGETFIHIASMAKNAIAPSASASQHLSPQVHWDLGDAHSDLESQVDEFEDYDEDGGSSGSLLGTGKDSQAKWKRKPRRTSRMRAALDDFGSSLGWVALPCAILYAGLIWNG
jgi:hypothetical protein